MLGLKNERGFTYLVVMFSVFLMGFAAAQQWQTGVQREKEAELFFRGDAIRRAIYTYCRTARVGMTFCPKPLADLVKAPGTFTICRYLRKKYQDPITKSEWQLIKSRNGRSVLGVRSKNTARSLKQGAFSGFEGKNYYFEWIFICPQLRTLSRVLAPFS